MSEVQQIIVFRKSSQSFSRMYLFVELGKADSQGEVIRLQRLRNRLWKISSPISLWKVFFTLHACTDGVSIQPGYRPISLLYLLLCVWNRTCEPLPAFM